jgi:hypothetical protein
VGKGRKRKILYVDKIPNSFSSGDRIFFHSDKQEYNLERLREKYDVRMVYNFLTENVDGALRTDFDLLLTHLPYNDEGYGCSLEKLRRFSLERKLKRIVVYTGAETYIVSDDILRQIGVNGVVRKDGEKKYLDLERIEDCLKKVFRVRLNSFQT